MKRASTLVSRRKTAPRAASAICTPRSSSKSARRAPSRSRLLLGLVLRSLLRKLGHALADRLGIDHRRPLDVRETLIPGYDSVASARRGIQVYRPAVLCGRPRYRVAAEVDLYQVLSWLQRRGIASRCEGGFSVHRINDDRELLPRGTPHSALDQCVGLVVRS